MTLILGSPKVQIFKDGAFLVGGKVHIYDAGTSTPRASYPTWDDAVAETNANANPVILDSRGEADIVIKGPTKVTVTDANDVELWSVDDLDTSSIDIVDVAGGALLTFTGVASAVNHIQISNAAAGSEVSIDAVGDDTNVGLQFKCKGTGNLYVSNGNLEVTLGEFTVTSGNVTLNSGNVDASSGTVNISNGELDVQSGAVSFTYLPAGVMTWFAGTSVPTGWLECDGSAVSRTTYANLFGKISTTFGSGDGSTTFNIPNLERRSLVGKGGTGTGELGNATGNTGGEESHTLTEAELPSHTHGIELWRSDTNFNDYLIGGGNCFLGTADDEQTSSSYGGGTAYNVRQPGLVMIPIIRAH